jgi:two-component system phosphate regulon response regulator PhoB
VLVVENDSAIRALIVELLGEAGYTVLEAAGGAGGLLLAEERVPSVMVVNHVLPDMSGLDVLERLRRQRETRGIPVVLVSGRVQQLAAAATGADRVVPLPFDIDVLLAHVAQLAGASQGAVA